MANEELLEEINASEGITQKYLGISFGKFILFIVLVIFLGVYLGILLYGTSSLEVLFGLQEYENYLSSEITRLKAENAQLQREYFELKEISAE
jgi:hypothetical protein